jgi:hypothetical protein
MVLCLPITKSITCIYVKPLDPALDRHEYKDIKKANIMLNIKMAHTLLYRNCIYGMISDRCEVIKVQRNVILNKMVIYVYW